MTYPEYTDITSSKKPAWPAQRRFINWLCEKHGIGSEVKLEEIKNAKR